MAEIRRILARAHTGVNAISSRFLGNLHGVLNFRVMSSTAIETFPNPRPERDFDIDIECPEFTSMCPKTGLPDFGTIHISYVPGDRCIELKALKYYLLGFRNQGIFYEHATNQILDDLVAACSPRRMKVVGAFTPRGGIRTTVTAVYEKK
jgi:7-cyano-7-deazaguanine reductase